MPTLDAPANEVVGAATAARTLQLSRRELQRLVERGHLIPLTKLEGQTGAYLFDASEVERVRLERAS